MRRKENGQSCRARLGAAESRWVEPEQLTTSCRHQCCDRHRAEIGNAHVDRLRCVAGSACALDESYPVETLIVCQVTIRVGWVLHVVTRIRKARNFGPRGTGVGAAPKSVPLGAPR